MQQFLRVIGAATLACGLFFTVSCARVEYKESSRDISQSPLPTPVLATPSAELHDIAVTAVDFDPLPRPDQPLDAEKSSLLAIVENRGNKVENQITVTATLRSEKDEKALFESKAAIEKLVPGESKVVRFSRLGSVPLKPAYELAVAVLAVPGEINLENNSKIARIEIVMTAK